MEEGDASGWGHRAGYCRVWWARRAHTTGNVAALSAHCAAGPGAQGPGVGGWGYPRLMRPRRQLDLAHRERAVRTARC